jgi:hypothetical protein
VNRATIHSNAINLTDSLKNAAATFGENRSPENSQLVKI